MNQTPAPAPVSRRALLAAAGGGIAAAMVAACQSPGSALPPVASSTGAPSPSPSPTTASPSSGRVHHVDLSAAPVTADLAGRHVSTWAYQGALAGPEIRVRRGDTLDVAIRNQLPAPTTVHWHGIRIRNASDGVPDVTQAPITPGGSYSTRFVVPDAGTYWYHSHVGVQLDRGLYGPLVIEDPDDPGVDLDQVIMLDDWLDGVDGTPDQALALLGSTDAMPGMAGMADTTGTAATGGNPNLVPSAPMISTALRGLAGLIAYPLHLLNGRPPADRPTYRVAPGGKVRLRFVNAGSDTAYRVAVGGHQLTVTHTDGWPIQPVTVSTLIIGMGERYDVTFTARSGAWPIYAAAEGKSGSAAAVLRTTDTTVSSAPPADARPAELSGPLLAYSQLTAAPGRALPDRTPDQEFQVTLVGRPSNGRRPAVNWGFFGGAQPLQVQQGERVRITAVNFSASFHPMHLHGHTFALSDTGVRKDTVNVLPGETLSVDLDTDNPGRWMYHCHNTYHSVMGMMTTLNYQ